MVIIFPDFTISGVIVPGKDAGLDFLYKQTGCLI